MNKLLLFAIIVGGSLALTSCSKKECVGDVLGTYTEDDVQSGSLDDYCTAAKLVDSTCSMK